jgi:hypothetical protein
MAYESATYGVDVQGTEKLKNQAKEALQRARSRSSEAIEDALDLARRHPGKTLAASLVAGGILGALVVNSLTSEKESSIRWEKLTGIGDEALEKFKAKAQDVLCAARDVIDTAIARYR